MEGDGKARWVRVLGQPIDAVSGRFSWSLEKTSLEDVRLRLGEGTAAASGEIVNGTLNVALVVDRWPAPELLSATNPVSGWLSFSGNIIGSLVDPMAHGSLRGGMLHVGNWSIEEPAGDVVITRELIHITCLREKAPATASTN